MKRYLATWLVVLTCLLAAARLPAHTETEPPATANGPVIAYQSTRAEVIAVLGEPTGTLREGKRQVLVYQGIEVTLEDGRVIRVMRVGADGSPKADPIPVPAAEPESLADAEPEPSAPEPSWAEVEGPGSPETFRDLLSRRAEDLTLGKKILIGLGLLVFVLGSLASTAAGIWFLVRAFQVHLGWGFACMLLPGAALAFLIKHWPAGGKPFLASLAATAVAAGGVGLVVLVAS